MLTFIIYIVIAMVASWIFKFVAGIIEVLSMSFFGLFTDNIEKNIELKPRRFFTVLILKNAIISLLNAFVIMWVTGYMILNYDVNYWLYVIASLIWSLNILTYLSITPMVAFLTCTGTMLCLIFGLGWIGVIILCTLTIIGSLAYHYGRINMYQQQFSQNHFFENEME